jgi:hypothetical protein
MSHSDNFVIESFLPQVGSPLFYHAVEEFVSLWEAFPSASYQQVVFQFLVNSLMVSDDDSWYDQVGNSVSSVVADVKESFFVANVVSDEVKRFQQALFPKMRVDNCLGHNKCSDKTCQLFHGPVCDFHAGKNTDNRRRLPNGATNPRFGKPMLCGKGDSCPFDHASEEVRKARVEAGIQQKRFQFAPVLKTEADILAVFPTIEWRFSDVYTYGGLSSADMDLLEICLERSPALGVLPLEGGLQIVTEDFMDSRDMKELEVHVPLLSCVADAGGWEVAPRQSRSDKGRR